MTKPIESLISGLVDYAGQYPPELLSLQESFENFIRYRNSEYGWIISKFVCPIGCLPIVSSLIESKGYNKIFPVSVILSGNDIISEYFDRLENNLETTKKINPLISIQSYETMLPAEIFERNNFLYDFISKLKSLINNNSEIFFEVKTTSLNYRTRYDYLFETLKEFPNTGLKFRMGGTEAKAFPPPEKIIYAIKGCNNNSVPFKAIGGLHHPFTHYDIKIDTTMYGFINLFCASAFADISEVGELIDILDDEEIDNFRFTGEYLQWKNKKISNIEIKKKRNIFRSFGCCSFTEPFEELKNLDLI